MPMALMHIIIFFAVMSEQHIHTISGTHVDPGLNGGSYADTSVKDGAGDSIQNLR